MNRLMIRARSPFIEQYQTSTGEVRWREQKHILTDSIVEAHIRGDRTVGVFYAGKASMFLFFDVDAEGDAERQEIRVRAIVTTLLRCGLLPDDIHVMFSGMKGYHVQVFFDRALKIESVAAFGRAILGQLGDYSSGVELRPESVNGRGVKLPLAYHKKSGMLAAYVDRFTLETSVEGWGYFSSIMPVPMERVISAISTALSLDRRDISSSAADDDDSVTPKTTIAEMFLRRVPTNEVRDRAKRLYEEGLPGKGTRHNCQFLVALYLRHQGLDRGGAGEQLQEWIREQWSQGRTNERDLPHLVSEASRCVDYVYDNPEYRLYTVATRDCPLTYDDLLVVTYFENRKHARVIWALIIVGRMFHEDGVFYVSLASLVDIAGVDVKTVQTVMRWLVKEGALQIERKGSMRDRLATVYHWDYLTEKLDGSRLLPIGDDQTVRQVFNACIRISDLASRQMQKDMRVRITS